MPITYISTPGYLQYQTSETTKAPRPPSQPQLPHNLNSLTTSTPSQPQLTHNLNALIITSPSPSYSRSRSASSSLPGLKTNPVSHCPITSRSATNSQDPSSSCHSVLPSWHRYAVAWDVGYPNQVPRFPDIGLNQTVQPVSGPARPVFLRQLWPCGADGLLTALLPDWVVRRHWRAHSAALEAHAGL
jgi:hypothetical protein